MAQRYRLFVQAELAGENIIRCDPAQAHYLLTVLRLKAGATVGLFNGVDGEWEGELQPQGRKSASIRVKYRVRNQETAPDLMYVFAPLKRARLDYMVQKATEMGANVLQPVITQYTNAYRLKTERMKLNAVEAAEQCNLLTIPEVREPVGLKVFLENWPPQRCLIYCDENADTTSPLERLRKIDSVPVGLLIGPEGGFSPQENDLLRHQSFVIPISLGPRIMRADTAAVAALALVQAIIGDWYNQPVAKR